MSQASRARTSAHVSVPLPTPYTPELWPAAHSAIIHPRRDPLPLNYLGGSQLCSEVQTAKHK